MYFVTNNNKERCVKLHHNDEIWVSKDCIYTFSDIQIGEYYCLNEYGKFEMYESQPIFNKQLFIMIGVTFKFNSGRKWWQFWKPKRIINGYRFQCIDLGERYNEI